MSTLIQDPNNPQNWFAGNNIQGVSQTIFFGNTTQTNTSSGYLKTLMDNALGSVNRSSLMAVRQGLFGDYYSTFQPSGYYGENGVYLCFRPNLPDETNTSPVSTARGASYYTPDAFGPNSRFTLRIFTNTNEYARHHSRNHITSSVDCTNPVSLITAQDCPNETNKISWYATANHKSVAIFGCSSSMEWFFIWAGVLNSSLALAYPTRCALIRLYTNDGISIYGGAFRPLLVDDPTGRYILTYGDANYSIVCSDGTNPATCNVTLTTLWLRDSITGSPAIGTCDNLLLGKGQSVPIGNCVYVRRKNTSCVVTDDPVEGSTTYSYIACALYGADTLFMRTADAFSPPLMP